jgi:hypothetical protein
MYKGTIVQLPELLGVETSVFLKTISVSEDDFSDWKDSFEEVEEPTEKKISSFLKTNFKFNSVLAVYCESIKKLGFVVDDFDQDHYFSLTHKDYPGISLNLDDEAGVDIIENRGRSSNSVWGEYSLSEWTTLLNVLTKCCQSPKNDTNTFLRCWFKALPDQSPKTLKEQEEHFKWVQEYEQSQQDRKNEELAAKEDIQEQVKRALAGDEIAQYNICINNNVANLVELEEAKKWLKKLALQSSNIGKMARTLLKVNEATDWKYFGNSVDMIARFVELRKKQQ